MKKKHLNLIDIVLILLVLAVAAGAYLITHQDDTAEAIPCTYVIEAPGVSTENQNAAKPGDQVVDNIRNYVLGTVTEVKSVPYTMPVLNEQTDTVVNVPVEDKVTLLITVEVGVHMTDSRILTENEVIIRIGQELNFFAGGLHSKGTIVDIKR